MATPSVTEPATGSRTLTLLHKNALKYGIFEPMESDEYDLPRSSLVAKSESLFERCHWLYALCREYLFRDHTEVIAESLLREGAPTAGAHLLELGCGPGCY